MGGVGGTFRALGDHSVSVQRKTKNKDLQKQIDAGITDNARINQQGQAALGDYISKYLANQAQFERGNAEEIGVADSFYNGAMDSRLAQLRTKRAGAMEDAANRGSAYAIRGVNLNRVGNEGGGSSYDTRQAIRNVTDIRTQAALDNANQERADLGYVTANQLGLAGAREQALNRQAGYGLVPEGVRRGMQAANTGALGGLTNLDQANNFYGLKKADNTAADIADAWGGAIMNTAAVGSSYSSAMAEGGEVEGPGTETSDSVPIMASDGEFVVNARSASIPGVKEFLTWINNLGHEGTQTGSGMGYRAGGYVRNVRPRYRRLGFAEGGYINMGGNLGNDWAGGPEISGSASDWGGWDMSGGGGQQKSGGGGGGGGLAGSAQQLHARSTMTHFPEWMGPAIIPASGGGGMQSMRPGPTPMRSAPMPMPQSPNYGEQFAQQYGQEAVPSNFGELHPEAQSEYMAMYARAREMEKQWVGGVNPYE